MHRLAFVPLLCSAGCLLYTGDLNHPPKVEVKVNQPSNYKGVPIHFEVDPTDPDHDVVYRDDPEVASLDGQPLQGCDYVYNNYGTGSFDIAFFRTGMFSVTTKVRDAQGATSTGFMVTIKVENAPPEFSADSKLTAVQALLDACSAYPAGEGIPIQLNKEASDADAMATGCNGPETISYHWTVTNPVAGNAVFTAYTNGACEAMSSSSPTDFTTLSASQEVCLWPEAGRIGISSTYTVKVTASDRGNDTASLTVDVPVQADGPPCIQGMEPPAGSYVVDPANPAPFDTLMVSSVADDLDGSLGPGTKLQILWSVWRETDPTWRSIPVSGYRYSPDFSIFGVGEKVRFRAEAVDRTLTRAPCNSDDDFCPVASCASTNCTQWTTWDLELR